jgi:Kef-type K+ transport system membrane component KefB
MSDAVLEPLHHLPPLARFAVVGLLRTGELLGPYGFGVAPKNAEVAQFFAEIGKLLLMFFAGMEIDLVQLDCTRNRSTGFGLLNFAFPLLAGMLVGFRAGYPWAGAKLIGSLLASHTLIAFPIAEKHGKLRHEAVTVAIGASVFEAVRKRRRHPRNPSWAD